MSEYRKSMRNNVARNLKATGAAALLAVSMTACNGTDNNAESSRLVECKAAKLETLYGKAPNATPIETASGLIGHVQEQLVVLHQRAINADGQIDLSRWKSIAEVKANNASLTLNFPNLDWPGEKHIHFNRTPEGPFKIALGAVTCAEDGKIYPNQVTSSIDNYVTNSAGFDAITR